MVVKVAINGYGTIGKRVARAAALQPDMTVVGVVKNRPNWEALSAYRLGFPLYVPEDRVEVFEKAGMRVEGTLEELLQKVDVVVDATPGGVGEKYRPLYEKAGVKAIFQGGEDASVADVSFNALANYDAAIGKRFVRVVSCNTTGLIRLIVAMRELGRIRSVRAVLVRRGADTKEVKKGPIEGLVLKPAKPPSHHAEDVKTVIGDIDIMTYAVVAPTTLAHMHFVRFEFEEPITREDVIRALEATPRIMLVKASLLTSTAELREAFRDSGRPLGDIYENAVWEDSVWVSDSEVWVAQAVHQEAIVVPENIDAIRAVMGISDKESSIKLTNETLGIRGWFA